MSRVTRLPAVSIISGTHRPRWRGRIHIGAFAVSIPAVAGLLVLSPDPRARIAAAAFGLSLIAVYGVSAAYHTLATTDRAQRIMRRADHSMIFVLIAGTYTPVCLLALPRSWSIPLLAAVWSLTAIGVGTKVLGTGRLMRASNGLYVVMGWLAIVALPVMLRTLRPSVLTLMVVGGVLYSIGAALFFLRRPDPHPEIFGYHEVWHTFTVLAGASHFAMVALVIR